ncbi:hypothetical protein BTR23_09310 [Alkalihalophilus pseudofirmus]|nr:hypothetical protein BTR23_09310 [Alkalihalophilus pseudofirmus]
MAILLIILLFIRMPIAFVLLVVGSIGTITLIGYDPLTGIYSTTAYRSINNFTFSTIPLFILMAHFMSKSRIADDLFECILRWIGHKPGGVGVSTVLGSAGFGTLTGSSIAATTVMSEIAVPKMIKAKYPDWFASGLVATSSGTLAVMIPPSIPLIIYGIQTENSIGKLLIAGILPGLLLAFLLCITVIWVGIKENSKTERYSWKERWQSTIKIWPSVLLILLVLSFIYFGFGTTTEAASFGAFGAMVIGLTMRRLNWKMIVESLVTTAKQSGMIFIIVVGAHVFTYYVTMTRVTQDILAFIQASGMSTWMILAAIVILYLILGMFMDLLGSLLVTLPLVYPLLLGLGYDPIWAGIVIVLLLEIGLVTPPVGINIYITSQHSGVPVNTVLRGSWLFIGVVLLAAILLIIFPEIVLFLPSIM